MAIGNLYGTGIPGYYSVYSGKNTVKKSDAAGRTEGTAGTAEYSTNSVSNDSTSAPETSDSAGISAGGAEEYLKSVSTGISVRTEGAAERAAVLKQLTGGISGGLTVQNGKYGQSIGDVSLSDTAVKYYESLKARYGNMNFILVSDDVKNSVQANAAAYAGSGKTTVLINVDKIEKMATDSSYRQKYESILTNAQSQLSSIASAAKQKSGGDSILASFGMSVSENGDTSMFAVFRKQQKDISTSLTSKRAEKAAERKKAEKTQAKKDAEAKIRKKISDKKEAQEKTDAAKTDRLREAKAAEKREKAKSAEVGDAYGMPDADGDDYDMLTSTTAEGLIEKIRDYLASGSVNTDGRHFYAEA